MPHFLKKLPSPCSYINHIYFIRSEITKWVPRSAVQKQQYWNYTPFPAPLALAFPFFFLMHWSELLPTVNVRNCLKVLLNSISVSASSPLSYPFIDPSYNITLYFAVGNKLSFSAQCHRGFYLCDLCIMKKTGK